MNAFKSSALLIIGCILGVSLSLALAQEVTPTPEDKTEMYREMMYRGANEGITPGKFDLVREILAEDFVLHSPLGEFDREGLIAFLGVLRHSLTDFNLSRDMVIVEGDFAVTLDVVTGIFDREFPTPTGMIPPNGQPIEFEVIHIFRFDEEGHIIEGWMQLDVLGFLTQLGAFPASES